MVMERIVKTAVVLRNNWKKSVFASLCALYGGNYAVGKYREALYMHEICLEAKAFGDAPLPTTAKPRHVTVILNPAANDGKCRAMFDKYCGPLLNLAGLKVGIIKTEKEGQAKDIMEIMDNTDAVIVAGGDGTVAEVVTGLLRRADRAQAVQRLPLALIPLGDTSGSATALLPPGEDSPARRITQATMALVRDTVRPLDAMEVQALETEAEVPGRPVYLLSNITWGAFRDVQARVSKYWYWGGLKERMAYVFAVFKNLTWSCNGDMEYTAYCAGCSRCYAEQKQQQQERAAAEQQQQQQARAGRWWSRFIPQPKPTAPPQPESAVSEDFSSVDNPDCGVWHRRPVSTIDWSLRTRHAAAEGAGPGLHLRLGPSEMSSSEFISEGWSRMGGSEPSGTERLTVDQVRLVPTPEERSASVTAPTTTDSTSTPAEPPANTRWFGFDGEEFEVRPVLIRLLPRAVRVFTERDTEQTAPVPS
ncbi:acylglycerol kinase, mitochondrial-like [Amphibalanus amphitrite]|uniref:acylglycerol kinase, mitochondrial-like n=1 Tax=Amphibalanus amphitrite TaxID=1232801 RepID=UPI001C91AD2F|nr:acylglycerol kinase, mitochondrial-like [Amphibalanus amphitrite]